jgi:hypothetical protein
MFSLAFKRNNPLLDMYIIIITLATILSSYTPLDSFVTNTLIFKEIK